MGIAMLTLSGLFQSLGALQRWTTVQPSGQQPHRSPRVLRVARPSVSRTQISPRPVSAIHVSRPAALRVLRVCDAQQTPGEVGRMVISGRMADVCAELDRLAAREAASARH